MINAVRHPVLGGALFLLLLALVSHAPGAPPAQLPVEPEFEDPVARLDPSRPRSEREEDRLHAASLYAHGRLLRQRGAEAAALRRLQRAWRYDPSAVDPMRDIVPLAAKLGRADEASRYAVLGAENHPTGDPAVLMRLAVLLSEQQQWSQALRIYEKVLKSRGEAPKDFTELMLHMEVGRLSFLQEAYRQSAESFAKVRDGIRNPDDYGLNEQLTKLLINKPEQTYELFGEAFLLAERWSEALEMFREARKSDKNSGLLAYHAARVAWGQKQPAAALQELQVYFDKNCSEAGLEPFELLETILVKQDADGKSAPREYRQRLEEIHKRFPENNPVALALAEHYRESSEWGAAEKLYRQLLGRQPSDELYTGLAAVCRHQKQPEALLQLLGEMTAQGGSLARLDDELDELVDDENFAQQVIRAARDIKPEALQDARAFAAAQLAVQLKDYDAADELFGRALKSGTPPRSQVFLTWGIDLLLADQPERSAKAFQRALDERVRQDASSTYAYYLAGALELAGKTDAALVAAQRALAEGSKTAQRQSRLAWIPYHAKRYADAERSYRELLATYDNDHATEGVRDTMRESRLILSNICVLTGRVPEAEEWLEQVLDEFPDDVGALNDLGYLWADQNKHLRRALGMCRRAVEAEPDNRSYRDSLGWALFRVGEFAAAIKELEVAAAPDDADGVILDHLGDARWKAGQHDAARAAWSRAVTAYERATEPDKSRVVAEKLKQPTPP